MINALMCVYKSGDVLGLALRQLVDAPRVTRILVADGPHRGPVKPGHKADHPSVQKVIARIASKKIVYEYTDDCPTRADKNNRALKQVSKDCQWILGVDSDEVYHEDALKRLVDFLASAPYDRYKIQSINPYPDLRHKIKIVDWKPRVYRWIPGARCPSRHDRYHQLVLHPKHKIPKDTRSEERVFGSRPLGTIVRVPPEVCEVWHLHELRATRSRVTKGKKTPVIWTGGGKQCPSKIYPLDITTAPKSIRCLGRDTL